MQYKFKCPKCGQKYVIDMPMSEYTSTGHVCENKNCKTELIRDVNDFAGGAIWKCSGAFGKAY